MEIAMAAGNETVAPKIVDDFHTRRVRYDGVQIASNISQKLPMPSEIQSLMPEWKPLAAKMQSGNITDPEILRLDELNQIIRGHLSRAAN